MNSQSHHGPGFDRDRDRERERELEEQRHRNLEQEEIARRGREREREREREQIERHAREDQAQAERHARGDYPPGAAHHSTAGSIPIHQPVASRISGAIHSPGGLLANHGAAAPAIPLGAPPGPPANFGGPLINESNRPAQHGAKNGASAAQSHIFAPMPHSSVAPSTSMGATSGASMFGPALPPDSGRGGQQPPFPGGLPGSLPGPGPHPAPPGPGGLTQGQQPILNVNLDFLSLALTSSSPTRC